jgi:hypothetical protein
MWELICHHTYRWAGLPVDLSYYDCHGEAQNVAFLPDGVAPDSGAVRFSGPQSRIWIRFDQDERKSLAWRPLVGIKVEATVRMNAPSSQAYLPHELSWPGTLIAGDTAFSFTIRGTLLFATFRGKSTWPLQTTDGIDSYSDTLNSQPYNVPIGQWVTLGFVHDGLDTMELLVNGQVIARRTGLLAGVPGVGPGGVSIGNSADNQPNYLNGDIDEIKVWRLDPHAMRRQFLSRPVNDATADCWERFLRCLYEALGRHPDCARFFRSSLPTTLDRLRRTIVGKGPETRARYAQACEKYAELWQAGKIDGPEMAQLLVDWCTWQRLVGISIEDDPEFQELVQLPCFEQMLAELRQCATLDCDPQLIAFLRLVTEACCRDRKDAGGKGAAV